MHVSVPRSSGFQPLYFSILLLTLALASAGFVMKTVGGWIEYASAEASWTTDETLVPLIVGDYSFNVPANMIRHANQRVPGRRLEHLDLGILWPGMTGYRKDLAEAFTDTGLRSATIYMTVEHRPRADGMSERLETVYKRLAREPAYPGPAGLMVLPMASSSRMGEDQVLYEPIADGGFVARCYTPDNHTIAPFCNREVRLARDLVMTYRFRKTLLRNWGRLEHQVMDLVRSLHGVGNPL